MTIYSGGISLQYNEKFYQWKQSRKLLSNGFSELARKNCVIILFIKHWYILIPIKTLSFSIRAESGSLMNQAGIFFPDMECIMWLVSMRFISYTCNFAYYTHTYMHLHLEVHGTKSLA